MKLYMIGIDECWGRILKLQKELAKRWNTEYFIEIGFIYYAPEKYMLAKLKENEKYARFVDNSDEFKSLRGVVMKKIEAKNE